MGEITNMFSTSQMDEYCITTTKGMFFMTIEKVGRSDPKLVKKIFKIEVKQEET